MPEATSSKVTEDKGEKMFFPIGPVLQWIFLKIYILLRGLLKGFLRRCTRLCELQRLCYGDNLGARRTLAVGKRMLSSASEESKLSTKYTLFVLEKSITLSRSPVFQKIHNELGNIALANELEKKWQLVEKAIEAICVVKGIDCKIHEDFPQPLRVCLTQIYGYQQLLVRLDNVRSIDFDHSNESHRLLLRKLWQQLQPDNTSALDSTLIGKHWKDIGFQGSDPATDFRGMGLLSLENLVFFATVFEDHARNILSHSLHPTLG